MKKTLIFFFFQCLISIFLTSDAFAFTTYEVPTSEISKSTKNTFETPANQQALFIEELGTAKTFEQIIPLNSFPYSEKNSGLKTLIYWGNNSEVKEHFFFRNNHKKLLSQQIFPFHLFW